MGSDAFEDVERYHLSVKVHHVLCMELARYVTRVSGILPDIEASRPRCSAGIQALCILNRAIEKANLLLQHCNESSKLYLALTGETILARCEKSRNLLEQSLDQIQNMVPVSLAVEISKLLDELSCATFVLEPSEEEAGKIMHELIHPGPSRSGSTENSELKALQLAASKLLINSPKSILIEKRAIKKQIDKVCDSERKKKKILMYLLYLLKKYGNCIMTEQMESACSDGEVHSGYNGICRKPSQAVENSLYGQCEARVDDCLDVDQIPPEEFKCPLSSRLMYEPVVIASGQTFERMWIQRWFDEGNTTCPITKVELAHQSWTPNTVLKELISKWCTRLGLVIPDPTRQRELVHQCDNSFTSIASLGSSINDLHLQVDLSNVSLGSLDNSDSSDRFLHKITNCFSTLSLHAKDGSQDQTYGGANDESFVILSKLAELPWQSQCQVVEDFMNNFEGNHHFLHLASTEKLLEALMRFLGDAWDLGDIKSLKTVLQLLLAYLKKISRYEEPHIHEDAFLVLLSVFDSEVAEQALAIVEILSAQPDCRTKMVTSGVVPSIMKILQSRERDLQGSSLKILYNISLTIDLRSHILPCIPKLVPFLKDSELAKYALLIVRNLCDIEEARISIAETDEFIACVAELLETGTNEDQEQAVGILLSLCSQRIHYCQLVLDEGFAVIPAVVNISINGMERAKVWAMELLRLLRDANDVEGFDSSGLYFDSSRDSGNCRVEKKSSLRTSSIFGKKLSIFTKTSLITAHKKK